MKKIYIILFCVSIILLSGCIQNGKWFGIIGEPVYVNWQGSSDSTKIACAEEMEKIMAEEGVEYKFPKESITEIIKIGDCSRCFVNFACDETKRCLCE